MLLSVGWRPRERRDPDHADDRGDQHQSPRALERRARPQVRGVGDDLVGDPEPGLAVGLAQRGRPEGLDLFQAPGAAEQGRAALDLAAQLGVAHDVVERHLDRSQDSQRQPAAAITPPMVFIPTIAATARAVSSSNERSPIEEAAVPATSNAPTRRRSLSGTSRGRGRRRWPTGRRRDRRGRCPRRSSVPPAAEHPWRGRPRACLRAVDRHLCVAHTRIPAVVADHRHRASASTSTPAGTGSGSPGGCASSVTVGSRPPPGNVIRRPRTQTSIEPSPF